MLLWNSVQKPFNSGGACVCVYGCYSWHSWILLAGNFVPVNKIWWWGENCPMGKVEMIERVKCMSSFWGGMAPMEGVRGSCGGRGCESLRGMGSGILLVMYYTLRGLGKGVGVGVFGLSACQHSHCAKAGVGAGVGPLLSSTDLWENQRGFLLRCSASRQSPERLK